jgi:hypothetical protein
VLDVGAWYRADRKLQATADAAALAGAHGLPDNHAEAMGLALEYGDKNEGGVTSGGVSFETSVDSVDVGATAKARTSPMSSARWAAPVAVDERHPLLHCTPIESCFGSGNPTTLDFFKVGPGAFRLINIDQSHGGTGPQTVGDWIEHGLDQYMPLDWYFSDSGIKPNSSNVTDAFDKRLGTDLLFPVYRSTRAQGSNFEYEVIGWVGFHLTGYDIHGSKDSRLYGWFTEIIWEGIQSESSTDPDFGARAISLIE